MDVVSKEDVDRYMDVIMKRISGIPVQYIP